MGVVENIPVECKRNPKKAILILKAYILYYKFIKLKIGIQTFSSQIYSTNRIHIQLFTDRSPYPELLVYTKIIFLHFSGHTSVS